MPRTVQDIIEHADELAKRFEDYVPEPGDRLDGAGLVALRDAVAARAAAERAVQDAVTLARGLGYSWTFIGQTLGTSGEAVRQRYGLSCV